MTLPPASNTNVPFKMTESATYYFRQALTTLEPATPKGNVTYLGYLSHAQQRSPDGAMLWRYDRPSFLLGQQMAEDLGRGAFYDLMGSPLWIPELEGIMLEGRTLTFKQFGTEGSMGLLIIEDGPADLVRIAQEERLRRERKLG